MPVYKACKYSINLLWTAIPFIKSIYIYSLPPIAHGWTGALAWFSSSFLASFYYTIFLPCSSSSLSSFSWDDTLVNGIFSFAHSLQVSQKTIMKSRWQWTETIFNAIGYKSCRKIWICSLLRETLKELWISLKKVLSYPILFSFFLFFLKFLFV